MNKDLIEKFEITLIQEMGVKGLSLEKDKWTNRYLDEKVFLMFYLYKLCWNSSHDKCHEIVNQFTSIENTSKENQYLMEAIKAIDNDNVEM